MLSPARLQAAFFYSREDRARFAGMSEALRMNLNDALMDKLDQQVLAGANGLFHGTNLDNHAAAAVTTFANYKADLAYARVDGRYANGVEELRIVMGSASYAHAATAYRASGNNADAIDAALDVLMRDTGGVKVSAHVPAVASSKQNAVIRLGMRRDMVAPIWEGVTSYRTKSLWPPRAADTDYSRHAARRENHQEGGLLQARATARLEAQHGLRSHCRRPGDTSSGRRP